jgi:hypothetical protein
MVTAGPPGPAWPHWAGVPTPIGPGPLAPTPRQGRQAAVGASGARPGPANLSPGSPTPPRKLVVARKSLTPPQVPPVGADDCREDCQSLRNGFGQPRRASTAGTDGMRTTSTHTSRLRMSCSLQSAPCPLLRDAPRMGPPRLCIPQAARGGPPPLPMQLQAVYSGSAIGIHGRGRHSLAARLHRRQPILDHAQRTHQSPRASLTAFANNPQARLSAGPYNRAAGSQSPRRAVADPGISRPAGSDHRQQQGFAPRLGL